MRKLNTSQTVLLAVTFLFSVSSSDCALAKVSKKKTKSETTTKVEVTKASDSGERTAVQSHILKLGKTVVSGDSKGLAELWTEDCVFVDEEGTQTKGKAALEKRFATVFANRGGQEIELAAENIAFPASNVALVCGTVVRKGINRPTTRFNFTLTKNNTGWLIATASEVPIALKTSNDHLKELEWLIGNWHAEGNGNKVDFKAEWAPHKNFILCTFHTIEGGDEHFDKQIIGWDPRDHKFVSWTFDSTGGFGFGSWSHLGKKWLIDSAGVMPDGSTTAAVNILADASEEEFTWQSINRSIDGISLADTNTLKVRKDK